MKDLEKRRQRLMKVQKEGMRPATTNRRDQLAATIFAAMLQRDPPSTFSENAWTSAVAILCKHAVRAADVLLAELDQEPG